MCNVNVNIIMLIDRQIYRNSFDSTLANERYGKSIYQYCHWALALVFLIPLEDSHEYASVKLIKSINIKSTIICTLCSRNGGPAFAVNVKALWPAVFLGLIEAIHFSTRNLGYTSRMFQLIS